MKAITVGGLYHYGRKFAESERMRNALGLQIRKARNEGASWVEIAYCAKIDMKTAQQIARELPSP